ncbi:uncharacterized protein LOC125046664 isoform X2 [Penaeus chinensis]|uniref:uncharacterized protein LOC125046664 isoform X2 n=1 Tax=Penaeus chinensis TaxID=139456 RepID=UPI001FB6FA6C|nr:uncharacterized protein LOC125046664 isoform X2 [Penaeus chinensis]
MMSNYTKLIWTFLMVAACVLPALTQDDLGGQPAVSSGSDAGSAVEGASDGHLGESLSNLGQKNNSESLANYEPLEGAPDANQEGNSEVNTGGSGASLDGGAESSHEGSVEGSNSGEEGSHEFSGPDSSASNLDGSPGEHAEGGDGSDLDDVQMVVSNVPNFDAEGRYNDTTDFAVGVNGWNFHGWWAKFNISEKNVMDIPVNEESKNHMTFICKVKEYESFLEKNFPALEDARIFISYYLSSAAEDLVMKLTMEQAGRPPLEIFTYTFPDDLLEHHEVWVTQEVRIPDYSRIQPFKIKLSLSSLNSSIWAADELQLLGSAPTSQPMMNFTYPPLTSEQPGVIATSPIVLTNHTLPAVNATSPPGSNASLSSNSSGDGTNQTSSGSGGEEKTEDSNVTGNITPAPSSGNPDFSQNKPRPTDSPRNDSIIAKPTSKPSQANTSSVVPPKASSVVPPVHSNASSVAPPIQSNASSVVPPIESNASSVDPGKQPFASTLGPNQPTPEGMIPQGNFTGIASFLNDLGRLESVAQAIWDAFYVFLALFCACLVALVALIVRGRCRPKTTPVGDRGAPPTLT